MRGAKASRLVSRGNDNEMMDVFQDFLCTHRFLPFDLAKVDPQKVGTEQFALRVNKFVHPTHCRYNAYIFVNFQP